MTVVDMHGSPVKPKAGPVMTEAEIVERVMTLVEHPAWELFVIQIDINAQRYSEMVVRPDFLELFLNEYGSLRSCKSEEIHGFARGLIYGMKLASTMPFVLKKTVDDKMAAELAEKEESEAEEQAELSEQGNRGKEGFRRAAHPDDLSLEE